MLPAPGPVSGLAPGAPPAAFDLRGLVSRHRSDVGLRWPSERSAALHRLPIRSVWAARCALRCAPMAARSLRHLTDDATLSPMPSVCADRCRAGGHGDGMSFPIFSLHLPSAFPPPVPLLSCRTRWVKPSITLLVRLFPVDNPLPHPPPPGISWPS
ncbi:hypothetical protein [Verminephrobacter eiseniae]|uniref:hypothetical protein n=1 Tax=Verminephrobacter eiseniae TaxID=364317 RepID=UPI0022382F88|nr:hypothetical protein [Verminephrobacter eiseniae]